MKKLAEIRYELFVDRGVKKVRFTAWTKNNASGYIKPIKKGVKR